MPAWPIDDELDEDFDDVVDDDWGWCMQIEVDNDDDCLGHNEPHNDDFDDLTPY